MKPLVSIIMGSTSDLPVMEKACKFLDEMQVPFEVNALSAHRTPDAVEEFARGAKERGIRVTCEVSPHHLIFHHEHVGDFDTHFKVNPPLRTPEDVQKVREALSNGTIDILTTDHAPHAAHEKETPFDEAPFGISGLDSAVALTWELVRDGVINEADMVRLWCHTPGRLFKIPINTFQPGSPADFFLFDPNEIWKLTPENIYSKSKNTPFLDREMFGRVKAHWVGGVKVA